MKEQSNIVLSCSLYILVSKVSLLLVYYNIIIKYKLEIIKYCQNNNINLITCLGTGNRFDPTKLEITTLNKTHSDPLETGLHTEKS